MRGIFNYLSLTDEISSSGMPKAEQVKFMIAVDAHRDNKVLVHCEANFRATGFIALYRILRLGGKKEDAFQDLRKIWNPEKFPVCPKFMDENPR